MICLCERGKKLGQKLAAPWSSQAVPHHSTNQALGCLTSEVGRDLVLSTRYGRQRHERAKSPSLFRTPSPMERCVAMAKHRSMDSLPECSKGVDSSSTGAKIVGSNPTAVTFAQAEQSQDHALTMRQATKLGPEWSLQGRFEVSLQQGSGIVGLYGSGRASVL